MGIVAHYEKRHRRRFPRHEFLHLCNTRRQQEIFAEAAAVREGVETMISREIPAALIREKTLEKTAVHRQTLIETVQDIYDREGAGRDFAKEWPAVFFNTLVRSQRHADVIERLAAER